MNDEQMIKEIRSTFVGEDYIDLAIQHYHNCRRNSMSIEFSTVSVFEFMDNDIKWFYNPIRDDIKKISVKSSQARVEVTFKLTNKWSMIITKWPDGYSVLIRKPNGKFSDSACGSSFEDAKELVEGWKYETDNS